MCDDLCDNLAAMSKNLIDCIFGKDDGSGNTAAGHEFLDQPNGIEKIRRVAAEAQIKQRRDISFSQNFTQPRGLSDEITTRNDKSDGIVFNMGRESRDPFFSTTSSPVESLDKTLDPLLPFTPTRRNVSAEEGPPLPINLLDLFEHEEDYVSPTPVSPTSSLKKSRRRRSPSAHHQQQSVSLHPTIYEDCTFEDSSVSTEPTSRKVIFRSRHRLKPPPPPPPSTPPPPLFDEEWASPESEHCTACRCLLLFMVLIVLNRNLGILILTKPAETPLSLPSAPPPPRNAVMIWTKPSKTEPPPPPQPRHAFWKARAFYRPHRRLKEVIEESLIMNVHP